MDDLPMKDTIVVSLSDMHSGGSTALCFNKFHDFADRNHTPTDQQANMFAHFEKCARHVSALRKKKRLIIVHDGDAVEGYHHNTSQVITPIRNEQVKMHTDLMKHFMKLVNFGKDDQLYYIKGTEVHTMQEENQIGKEMGAEMNGSLYAFDELNLTVNSKNIWFAHKGPSAGKGANQGNSLHNFIRDLYLDCVAAGIAPPDVAIFGHVHTPRYRVFSRVDGGQIEKMEGWILPSWQMKTRFGHSVAAMQINSIGLACFEVGKSGDIFNQQFVIM